MTNSHSSRESSVDSEPGGGSRWWPTQTTSPKRGNDNLKPKPLCAHSGLSVLDSSETSEVFRPCMAKETSRALKATNIPIPSTA